MAMMGTTICAVKRGDHVAIAGDGQVTMGKTPFSKPAHARCGACTTDRSWLDLLVLLRMLFRCVSVLKKNSRNVAATWNGLL